MTRWKHEVFLSFRGEDTRRNFADHLYSALIQAEIHVFRDDEDLPSGKHISSELFKAIQESKISIVVFSKGYASSRWCLDELVKIVECSQIVMPIFYNVSPSDVGKQTGCFADAFATHIQLFDEEQVNKWRDALIKAADLSGWDLQNVANGHESKFIQKIVEDVLRKLNRTYLNVAKHPVGIDSSIKEVIDLLSVGANDVRIVGIHGIGGIGKTTIAKAVFNQFCGGFEGSSFLSNIKDISAQPCGVVLLQEQLLCAVLKPISVKINGSADRGTNLIKERLSGKRLLVVFDDVDQREQINALVGDRNWFGSGSRLIFTARDEHLLTQIGVDEKYQVEELNRDESLQLFSLHAFNQIQPVPDYLELSNAVVDYAGGLPLALEVLGSYLSRRSLLEWISALEKLRKIPHHQIQRKLRISYDTLDDDTLKNIFLDIACFFIGTDKYYVVKILQGCSFFPEIGINVLIQRSLVKIDSQNRLDMHDLVRDMGREIIREISPNHPGKRSRLWFHEDVLSVLNNKRGTEAVEGLILDVENVNLSTQSFAKMRYLRLLKINKIHLAGCYNNLSTELRWLCWHKCPLKFLPRDFQLDNLVVLDMQYSNVIKVWKEIRVLNNLQILNLSHSYSLAKTPNFMGLVSLERLELQGCKNLVEIHQCIGHLKRLVVLNLEECKSLKNLPQSISCLKCLETLNISYCSKLEKLPEKLGNMESLTQILAYGTAIKLLPFSVGNLKSLRNISLGGLMIDNTDAPSESWFSSFSSWISPRKPNLKSYLLPASFSCLSSLQKLELRHCNLYEDSIPSLANLSSLQHLDFGGNSFSSLPPGIRNLTKLANLYLSSCKNLVSISDLPPSVQALHAHNCTSLEKLSIQSNINGPILHLPHCKRLIEIEGLENVENQPIIHLEDCNNLANCFKENLVQVLSEYKLLPTMLLPGGEIPGWFSYQREGSSLSFYIPSILQGHEIQGLIIWGVYSTSEKYHSRNTTISPFAVIRNMSNGHQYTHKSTFLPTPFVRKDHSWLSYLPFSWVPCAKEGGEEMEMSIIAGDNSVVKKCGVHLIYTR